MRSLRRERDEAQAAAKAAKATKAANSADAARGGDLDRAKLRRAIKRALRRTHPDKREVLTNAEMTVILNELLEGVPA